MEMRSWCLGYLSGVSKNRTCLSESPQEAVWLPSAYGYRLSQSPWCPPARIPKTCGTPPEGTFWHANILFSGKPGSQGSNCGLPRRGKSRRIQPWPRTSKDILTYHNDDEDAHTVAERYVFRIQPSETASDTKRQENAPCHETLRHLL